jgi:hypothetical protein
LAENRLFFGQTGGESRGIGCPLERLSIKIDSLNNALVVGFVICPKGARRYEVG